MKNWSLSDIPTQHGKLAIVTGTGGLGFETALALAGAGARVVLAGRSTAKGHASVEVIETRVPGAVVRHEPLDLASLASVRAFGERMQSELPRVDMLINNAGVMTPPTRQTTADGFELQFGTNYLGHFALTAYLLPLLRRSSTARVNNLSSLAHRSGAICFADLQAQHGYRPWATYAQSKLAMLLFALELQRRSDAAGWRLMSNAAHPGFARTDLISNGPGTAGVLMRVNLLLQPWISHSAAAGALPTLFAATAPQAAGGAYYGPAGMFELKGAPTVAKIARQALDRAVAARLWSVSEELTGVSLAGLDPGTATGARRAAGSAAEPVFT